MYEVDKGFYTNLVIVLSENLIPFYAFKVRKELGVKWFQALLDLPATLRH